MSFGNGYIKLKYEEKERRYSMDSDSLAVCIKTEEIYTDIAKRVGWNNIWYFKFRIR